MTDGSNLNKNEENINKDRCMFCEEMFDLFCCKAGKNVGFEEFGRAPYKPDWCPGRTPSNNYHD